MSRATTDDLLMAKFYVVDGLSYPACEAAIGHFGGRGYKAMKACCDLGFEDRKGKESMSLATFLACVESPLSSIGERLILSVDPLEYYLTHGGFGVDADADEITMARHYLVEGMPYLAAEQAVGLDDRKGFAAMYAVCKLGGLRGPHGRKSMNSTDFQKRLKVLGLA